MLFLKDEDIQNLVTETAKAVKDVEDETAVKVKRKEEDGAKAESGYTPLPDYSALETGPIHEQAVKAKQRREELEADHKRYQEIIADWRDNHPNAPLDGGNVFRYEDGGKWELHDKDRFHQSLIGLEVEFIRDNGAWETGVCVDFFTHPDHSYWLMIGGFDGRLFDVQWSRCRIKGGWHDAESAKQSVQSDTQSD